MNRRSGYGGVHALADRLERLGLAPITAGLSPGVDIQVARASDGDRREDHQDHCANRSKGPAFRVSHRSPPWVPADLPLTRRSLHGSGKNREFGAGSRRYETTLGLDGTASAKGYVVGKAPRCATPGHWRRGRGQASSARLWVHDFMTDPVSTS